MKKGIYFFLLLSIANSICLTIQSCKKNDKPPNPLVGAWKMTAYIHDGMDVYGTQILPCYIDNIITFQTDLKIIGDEGATKCDSSDPQTITGTYSLNTDNTQLTIVYNGSSGVNQITTLNSTTLILEQASNGDIVTYTKVL